MYIQVMLIDHEYQVYEPCINMGQKLGGGVPFFWGSWVHIEHNVAQAEAYLHAKFHLDPSSRSATRAMGRNFGVTLPPASASLLGGGWVPI